MISEKFLSKIPAAVAEWDIDHRELKWKDTYGIFKVQSQYEIGKYLSSTSESFTIELQNTDRLANRHKVIYFRFRKKYFYYNNKIYFIHRLPVKTYKCGLTTGVFIIRQFRNNLWTSDIQNPPFFHYFEEVPPEVATVFHDSLIMINNYLYHDTSLIGEKRRDIWEIVENDFVYNFLSKKGYKCRRL